MRKLEIGPGETRLGADWETLDCVPRGWTGHYVAEWGAERLPFEDSSFDLVYAAHCLEHVPWMLTNDALAEVFRILKPGGVIEVWVPDFAYIVACYLDRRCGDNWRRFNPEGDPMTWVAGRLFTYGGPGGNADPNWHRACFDAPHLANCLIRAGFVTVERMTGHERGHRHGPISLGMRGKKT